MAPFKSKGLEHCLQACDLCGGHRRRGAGGEELLWPGTSWAPEKRGSRCCCTRARKVPGSMGSARGGRQRQPVQPAAGIAGYQQLVGGEPGQGGDGGIGNEQELEGAIGA